MWLRLADLIRPTPPVRPSEWAEANVVLSETQSLSAPGRFRCSWRPWIRDILDMMFNNPGKRGVICVKPAQIGFSTAMLNLLGALCTQRPGPILYLIGSDENAKNFVSRYFNPLVKSCPPLAKIFADIKDTERQLLNSKPFLGGRIDFAGGGSPGSVSTWMYGTAIVDELEIVMDNFPDDAGDPVGFVLNRQKTVENAIAWIFSHPRRSDRGTWKLYQDWSDQRAWMFDCPRGGCGMPVDPTWDCIHIEGLKEAGPRSLEFGRADPNKAVFRCPMCRDVITDAERCRLTWAPKEGGSGRFHSRLETKVAADKEWIGLHIDGLADPNVTVGGLARKLLGKATEEERRTFFNLDLGEKHDSSSAAVTVEHVKEVLKKSEGKVLVPGGKFGVQFAVGGADVQAPEFQPTMYARAECYGPMPEKWITCFEKLSGWDALAAWIAEYRVPVAHESGNGIGGWLGLSVFTIDAGYLDPQVFDFCRRNIISKASGAPVILLPVRYEPYVKSTQPFYLPPVEKRIDPARRYLGPQERYDLCREIWVDREMRRWMDGRVIVPEGVQVPPDLAAHLTANVRVPAPDIHKIHRAGNENLIWEKQKDKRDDWMQSGAYCEAGAVIKLGVDRLAELASLPEAPPDVEGDGGGRFGRFTRSRFGG